MRFPAFPFLAGKIIKLFKTGHVLGLVGETVCPPISIVKPSSGHRGAKNAGFKLLSNEGKDFTAGAPMVKVDTSQLLALEKDPVTPVVFIGGNQRGGFEDFSNPPL